MPRERLYTSNADRQAAYRARLAERQALADGGGLVGRLAELEAGLAAANRRAEMAERRAERAERDAQVARDRYVELLATRPGPVPGAPGWAKDRLEERGSSTAGRPSPGLNRAARRRAERERRRGH